MGSEVNAEGIRPGKRKINSILGMKDRCTVREIRQFLGLAGFFPFIKNYASIVEPLTRLTKKNIPWTWCEQQQKAVAKVKELLTKRPILAVFDPNLETELHTDASALGFGAMLLQKKEKMSHVIAYFSKKTTPEQSRYHSYELETLAVILLQNISARYQIHGYHRL